MQYTHACTHARTHTHNVSQKLTPDFGRIITSEVTYPIIDNLREENKVKLFNIRWKMLLIYFLFFCYIIIAYKLQNNILRNTNTKKQGQVFTWSSPWWGLQSVVCPPVPCRSPWPGPQSAAPSSAGRHQTLPPGSSEGSHLIMGISKRKLTINNEIAYCLRP